VPDMQPRDAHMFAATFRSVNHLINTVRMHLPSLEQLNIKDPTARTILLTHSLINAATMKLHGIFSYVDSVSRQQCLEAAKSMFRLVNVRLADIPHVNPIMGTLWTTAIDVLLDEITRLRDHRTSWAPDTPAGDEELLGFLREGMTALSTFTGASLLMSKCSLPGSRDSTVTAKDDGPYSFVF